MKPAEKNKTALSGRLIAAVVAVVAVLFALYAAHWGAKHPSSDDATIDADIVHVASAVGGKVLSIAVSENARVSKGDLLFQIDPLPYQLAVEQTEADLRIAEADLESKQRFVDTQRSNAQIAGEQTRKAQTNYDLASRTTERLKPLAAKGYVPSQQFDQAEVTQRDAATSLRQAQVQQVAAAHAVDTIAAAEAAVKARQAALAIARRQLDDTTVRALHDGLVVGLTTLSGETVAPGQALFTLISTEDWFAVANFRESDLKAIAVGDCATVFSLIDRQRAIKGTVQGIGWGVADLDRVNIPRSVPYVEPSLNWVRVAHRFPVRIQLENPPGNLMRVGASAVAEIKHGAACR